MVKFTVFLILLAIMVMDLIVTLRPPDVTGYTVEAALQVLQQYTQTLGTLDMSFKIVTVVLFCLLVFPRSNE
jgi:hypothetical protein